MKLSYCPDKSSLLSHALMQPVDGEPSPTQQLIDRKRSSPLLDTGTTTLCIIADASGMEQLLAEGVLIEYDIEQVFSSDELATLGYRRQARDPDTGEPLWTDYGTEQQAPVYAVWEADPDVRAIYDAHYTPVEGRMLFGFIEGWK